ncbi:MAG TPA: O-antigen ligase family protein [Pyrinomonadaceae bacterium]|nr:O-antigen ligase family protein [Pyrinomonadaceae bacterium]
MTTAEHAPGREQTGSQEPSARLPRATFPPPPDEKLAARAASRVCLAGLILHAVFAPHSIAGAWISLSIVAAGWLVRALATRRTNLARSPLDLPLLIFVLWTLASALLSFEPRISLSKLPSVSTFLVFYLAQGTLKRRLVAPLAALMIVSAAAGVVWSVGELAVGRGVVIEEVAPDSPFRRDVPQLQAGDAVWRIGSRRVSSAAEIDDALRGAATGTRPEVHVISRGEHVVWDGPAVTDELKRAPSPSGLSGTHPTRRFRASGWTRHYQTHAEILQMLAQLALGFALARLRREKTNADESRGGALLGSVWLPASAFVLLAVGVALTAMRTVLVAFALGALVVAWRAATTARARVYVSLAVCVVLAFGALAVWRTRAEGALRLQDDSSAMRLSVARRAAERVPLHPVFGHGMDSVKSHWEEWGFPGAEKIHFHSTWVQLAFDRGLPALALWLWLAYAFRRTLRRAERVWRDSEDAAAHGFTLGAAGALAGFLASSLVNYNFGDSEVALLFWWLAAASVLLSRSN